jgi:fucose 4-O-acetylase-like acetyltransferase
MGANTARIGWIDEFKGFVLVLVCLFHVEQSFPQAQMGMLHLGALRMSAFFFISGFLFSTRRFPDFKSYFVHKTKVLLWPYIALSLLFLALDPVLYHFAWFPRAPRMVILNTYPAIHNVWDYIYWNLAKIFVVGKSSIGSGPLWFVFTLYSISLMFFALQKLAKTVAGKNERGQKAIIALAAAASLTGGWLLYKNHVRLPLGIERDLTTLAFFACGYICKGIIQKQLCDKGKKAIPWSLVVATSVTSFVLYAAFENPDPNFSIMNNDLGKSLAGFLASSAFGIAGLVTAFVAIGRIPAIAPLQIVKGILRNISRNALVILAVHWYALLVMRIVYKAQINRPGTAYLAIPIVVAILVVAIPLFRCKLYKLLGKEKISLRESLSIK